MRLTPIHLTISKLLEGRLFRIPEYQRAYSWGERQRRDLFKDIELARDNDHEHFMATVVALAIDARSIGADDYKAVQLVDGQQRITTLIILLKAIHKYLNPAEGVARKIRELLVKGDYHSLILLQTNHDTSEIFTNYVRDEKVDPSCVKTEGDQNLVDAIFECENFVETWKEDYELTSLFDIVSNKLSVIYHELDDESTVYRIFEVLNSRGLDVKWIDKLKSQLMAAIYEHADSGAQIDAVNEMRTSWGEIYRTLGLRSDLGDEALRFAGTYVMKQTPNKIASEKIASAELLRIAGNEIKDIAAAAAKLKSVVLCVDKIHKDARIQAVCRIRHARFVAAAIMLSEFDKNTKNALVRKWEKTTFRIFGLGGADSRNKVGEYVRLGYGIYNGTIGVEEISDRLDLLSKDFAIEEIVRRKNFWDKRYQGWVEELRYLLYRYDEYLSRKYGEELNVSQWNKIWQAEPSKSIEHIMPQNSKVGYLHHIGNLTMLPPGVNSSLKDKNPKDKADTYKRCGLRATAKVGEIISEGTRWSSKAVRMRAKDIEKFVVEEWS